MIPYVIRIVRMYAPMAMLPIAFVIGAVGYGLENLWGTSKNPPYLESVQQKREERLMEELRVMEADNLSTLKEKKFVPKSIFTQNVSPNLLDDNDKKN